MALLYLDSFDHYATADISEKWSTAYTNSAVGASYARTGTQGMRLSGVGGARLAVGGETSLVCGAAVRPVTMASLPLFRVGNANYPEGYFFSPEDSAFCCLHLDADGTLSVYVGNGYGGLVNKSLGAVAGATATPYILHQNVWSYVELSMTAIGATSRIRVRVNNGLALDVIANTICGYDIGLIPILTWSYFTLGPGKATTLGVCDVDDLYVATQDGTGVTNFVGDCRIDCHYPTAPGTHTEWTRTGSDSGANWDQVNDTAPNDDTDANDATSAALVDTFACDDLVPEGNTIVAVQHVMSVKKTDDGAATVAPVLRVGGTDYVGDDQYPSAAAFSYGRQLYVTSPAGGAWSESAFDGMEVGYKRTT